jgi:hypothetical protein
LLPRGFPLLLSHLLLLRSVCIPELELSHALSLELLKQEPRTTLTYRPISIREL